MLKFHSKTYGVKSDDLLVINFRELQSCESCELGSRSLDNLDMSSSIIYLNFSSHFYNVSQCYKFRLALSSKRKDLPTNSTW